MTYQELLQNMLSGWSIYYQQTMSGDFSQICYTAGHNKTYGTYDMHSTERLKLCAYLLYCHKTVPEEILLRLFEEECQNLETNSFQGVSTTICILHLLLSVSQTHYSELFERAKNANFDCFCGYAYETELFRKSLKNIPEFDTEDCLRLAYDTHETAYALQFLDIMQSEYIITNKSDCHHLIWWNEQLGRTADNEPLLKKMLDFSIAEQNQWDIIAAHHDLLKFFTEQEKFSEAYQEFEILSAMDLSCCREANLFLYILESCLDLINADIPETKIIWKWAIPYIKYRLKTNIYGNFYKKLIPATQKMNPPYAKKIQKQYYLWKKINKIS